MDMTAPDSLALMTAPPGSAIEMTSDSSNLGDLVQAFVTIDKLLDQYNAQMDAIRAQLSRELGASGLTSLSSAGYTFRRQRKPSRVRVTVPATELPETYQVVKADVKKLRSAIELDVDVPAYLEESTEFQLVATKEG